MKVWSTAALVLGGVVLPTSNCFHTYPSRVVTLRQSGPRLQSFSGGADGGTTADAPAEMLRKAELLRAEAATATRALDLERQNSRQAQLKRDFVAADLDGDGVVSISELQEFLTPMALADGLRPDATARWASNLVEALDRSQQKKGLVEEDFLTQTEFEQRLREFTRLEAVAAKERRLMEIEESKDLMEDLVDMSKPQKRILGEGGLFSVNMLSAVFWQVLLPLSFITNVTNKYILPYLKQHFGGDGGFGL